MKLIEFPEQTIVIAKDQPQYLPMPAHVDQTSDHCQTTLCWELTDEEIQTLIQTKKIWQQIWTFHRKMHPQRLSVEKPEMKVPDAD